MAPAPAPAPVPALPPPMDTKDEGDGGTKNQNSMVVDEADGGAKNQNSMVVVKSEAVCTDVGPLVVGTELVKYEGGDTTECSSSFDDTCSGFEGEADNGEPEVNSGMPAHADGVEPSKPPRRKKVTAEWSNSVRPIQWRCQWLELRMKQLSSQISKYDKELALIKKQKELQQAVSKENGTMSESMQIHKGHGNSIMKRRKRKRHEENVDASLYINKHRILSYYHDKQNKGAEADGLLIDDDCGSTVDGSIRGGLDTATLLDSENYDMICEQRTLQDILMTIDGIQSRVHLMQDRLSKAHSEGENLPFSGGNTDVRVARKRQHTHKHSFSYTKSRHTKPQKKRNLNILLKDDDDGQALAGGPALPDRETDVHIIGTSRTEETSGECTHSRGNAITVDLLLGTGNSITNSDIGDLYKVNTDDILIDNQAAIEACQQFHKAKHLPSGSSSKDQIISAPAEMKNNPLPMEVKNTCGPVKVESICAPVEVDSTSAPALEQESFLEKSPLSKPVSPGNKQELKPNERMKNKGTFTKEQRKEASKTPIAKEKAEGMSSAAKKKRSTQKTESTLSAATGPGTMTTRSAGKKRKSGNEPADAKKKKTGKPSSAVKKQKTESSTTAAKGAKAGNASSATKKQETESSSSTEKKLETASAPQKLQVNKAILVVNSRRSQRVRKPKVFAE